MKVLYKKFMQVKGTKGIIEIYFPCPDRFYFGSGQNNARIVSGLDVILKLSFFVDEFQMIFRQIYTNYFYLCGDTIGAKKRKPG